MWVVACVYTCGWMDGRLCVRTTLQASPTAAPLYSYANSNTHQCSQCNQGFADVSVAVKSEGGQRALEALHHDLLPGLVALLQVRARLCRWFLAYMYICIHVCVHPPTYHLTPPPHQNKQKTTPQDNEAEVRTAACSRSFAAYCDVVGAQLFVQHLVPCAQVR